MNNTDQKPEWLQKLEKWMTYDPNRPEKPLYKKVWFWLACIVIIVGIIVTWGK